MTVLTVTHTFVSAIADGGDATLVQPSNWNANHTLAIAGTSGGIPYFDTATSLNTSAALAANRLVVGGGAGTAPFSASGTTWDNTNLALTIAGATVTTSNPILNLSQTWNAGAVTFTALKLNVTNTASAAASLLIDLQVGGASMFSVSEAGLIANAGAAHFGSSVTWSGGLYGADANYVYCNGLAIGSSSFSTDTAFYRQATATAALADGVTASAFRVYNTTDSNTSPTNYERFVADWTTVANVLTIGTQAGGTGSGRAIRLVGGPAKAVSLYNFGVAPVTDTSATYSVVDSDQWLIFNGAGSITVTLPAAGSYTGREITMKTIAAQTVVSASSNVVPAGSATAGTAILAGTAGKFATLVSDGTNWIIMQSN